MSFGENLQLIRKKNQLSQEGLAEMLGVSRQAVSKWELGEGYPEVDKLLLLSKKLNVSLDSLLGGENTRAVSEEGKASAAIKIISPHEGVIINASKVTRSQQFKGGKNSPKFALYASDGNDLALWGAQNTFLAWYRNLEDVTKELAELQAALDAGAASYTLQYSVKCKQNLLRTIED
ncbi:MAG: helix-turn-helix transcriptional regulator [Clostridia bacterium]|nr:helix-turn-helix transcriptional regulator [Clostridia bacterium]